MDVQRTLLHWYGLAVVTANSMRQLELSSERYPLQVKSEHAEAVKQQWQAHCDSIRSKLATAGTVSSYAVSLQLEEIAVKVTPPSAGPY